MVFDEYQSFRNYNGFYYEVIGNAEANGEHIYLVNGTSDAEGGFVGSHTAIAPGATDIRFEISFNTENFTSDDVDGTYFYLAVLDPSVVTISAKEIATTRTLSEFQGLLLEVHFGQSSITANLFHSTSKVTNFNMATNAISTCPSFANALLASSEDLATGTNWIALQVADDFVSASLAALDCNTMTAYMFSNYELPGFGGWLSLTNATVYMLQYNPIGSEISINVKEVRSYANGDPWQPITFPPSTTTTAMTSTTASIESTTEAIDKTVSVEVLARIESMLSSTAKETSFPIPELTEGNSVPLITVEELMGECEYILPSVRAPNDANTTDVYLSFKVDRLLEIKDIDETIIISATMYMQWGVFTCDSATTSDNVKEIERVIVLNPEAVWNPVVRCFSLLAFVLAYPFSSIIR